MLAIAILTAACTASSTVSPTAPPTSAPGASGLAPSSSAAAATAVSLPAAETKKLTIGLANSLAIELLTSVIARDLGLYQKHGLDVTVTSFEGANAALQALVSEQVQAVHVGPGSSISAARTDSPLVVTTVDSTALAYSLVSAKDIKSAADLKGKGVGISGYGVVSHAAALAGLSQLGLKASDVTLQLIGGESARIAAVASGAVAATVVQSVNAPKLVDQGLNVLVDLNKTPVKFALAGLTVTKAWAARNPNTMLRIIAAELEAQKVMFTKPSLAAQTYMAFTSVDQPTATAALQACGAGVCNKGFRFTKEDLVLNQEILAGIDSNTSTVDLATVMDLSYLEKLQQLGFNAEIEFP